MYPQFNLHAQLYGAQASCTKHLVRYSPNSFSSFSFRTRKVSPGKSANFSMDDASVTISIILRC